VESEHAAAASPRQLRRSSSGAEQWGIPPLQGASADSSQGTALPLIVTRTYASASCEPWPCPQSARLKDARRIVLSDASVSCLLVAAALREFSE
jgi:hypothetical protein